MCSKVTDPPEAMNVKNFLMTTITPGTRVWLEDFNGSFIVTSTEVSKAHCSHEFIYVDISPDISKLKLTEIQRPNIGFWVSIHDGDYPVLRSSRHFKNDFSEDCIMNFFCSILDRTIAYFKKYDYSVSSMFQFQIELEGILNSQQENVGGLTNFFIEKYYKKLPRNYENSYMILFSNEEGFLTFYIPEYGDESLQMTILMVVNYIHGKLNKDLALRVTKILFNELENELNLEDPDFF